ncbi:MULTISPECIES: hypothetical protein [Sphingobacterium]|jgi:hypothetical protein|uniref:hypothetical protein n=1 Tax=Sphingobacterium TaxID=28453 RepID=UPI0004E5FE57|nr:MULTISPECIES: hypothetical protein [Sphingobacterium]CDS97602.1 conserved hypothetical protein [Sphingobacterium sp. PM2-P1-29]SJN42727.1 hypothetical protein FM120_14010 [Sphingobacterium faecium PCAi_F2.5]UPZ36937.1 hypothetical protein MUB18_01180 [Sphingobacterium sp. PCS056]UXD68462.1 hypothetical protein MUK51_14775 [Sphingobacterium faecium]WGQ16167.1 hypothetical protein QG727_07185 [Sphingobacterium faecium]
MQYYLKSLRHYLVSHSRHGTHSPFVYQLVDQVLYRKPTVDEVNAVPLCYKRAGKREEKNYLFVERLLRTFPFGTYKISDKSNDPDLVKLFERNCTILAQRAIYYINTVDDYQKILFEMQEDDIIIVDSPHLSKDQEKSWRFLKQHSKVVVTIDLFHLGLVFFRKGQRKEDFIIRF